MPAANMIVAALIGYRFYGLDGACIGAVASWLLAFAGGALMDYHYVGLIAEGREAKAALQSAPDSLKQIEQGMATAQQQRSDIIRWLICSPMPDMTEAQGREAIMVQAAIMGLDPEKYRKAPTPA